MVDKSGAKLGFGAVRIQAVVNNGIDLLVARMLRHAKAKPGGRLTFADIRAIVDGFRNEPDAEVRRLYAEAWAECEAAVEAARWDKERKFPLERLMVHNFAHLLPGRGQPAVPGRHLSRRIIPAFVQALQQLVGPEQFEEYQTSCRKLVQRLRTTHGERFAWDHVHEDPTSQVVVNDVLVYIARHFMDMERRRRWMVDMIDTAMPAAREPAERGWRFGDAEFHLLMDALYTGLRGALETAEGTAHLAQRYGKANMTILTEMLRDLAADRATLAAPPLPETGATPEPHALTSSA